MVIWNGTNHYSTEMETLGKSNAAISPIGVSIPVLMARCPLSAVEGKNMPHLWVHATMFHQNPDVQTAWIKDCPGSHLACETASPSSETGHVLRVCYMSQDIGGMSLGCTLGPREVRCGYQALVVYNSLPWQRWQVMAPIKSQRLLFSALSSLK